MNSTEFRVLINNIKLETGCTICGYRKNTASLHFDHIDPSTKYRDKFGKIVGIAQMTTGSGKNGKETIRYSLKTIMKEIEKCRVLCANCHGEITHPQYNVTPVTSLQNVDISY